MNIPRRNATVWILSAGILGFTTAGVFSGLLHWSRTAFVMIYLLLVLSFVVGYTRLAGLSWRTQFQRRWRSGLVGGVVLGLLLARSVLARPGSERPRGLELVFFLGWYGVVYGAVDALLLNILPVLEVYRTQPAEELRARVSLLPLALAALLASLFVTAMYHLGFVEFRGVSLLQLVATTPGQWDHHRRVPADRQSGDASGGAHHHAHRRSTSRDGDHRSATSSLLDSRYLVLKRVFGSEQSRAARTGPSRAPVARFVRELCRNPG